MVPRAPEPKYDRDYVVMLSDWTDEDPMTVVANLKQQSDYYNHQRRTFGTFLHGRQAAGPEGDGCRIACCGVACG